MKNNIKINIFLLATVVLFTEGCTKLLDKQPVTQIITPTDSISYSANDAENSILGLYNYYKGDITEFSVFDRITNGDVISDNAYAGGDNAANITLDQFRANALNGNLNRDWADAYSFIGRANITISQVQKSTDAVLTPARKNQILGEARFLRAFNYFDLVRLFGRAPIITEPAKTTSAEALLNSTFVRQSSTDSVYDAILNDLWFAKANVREIGGSPSKYIITKGVVNATLAKVYATRLPQKWDSVNYYCNQVIPNYSMLPQYSFLWDNVHKNNSEAIWEINYDGYSSGDQIGNWVPSIFVGGSNGRFEGGGWKKFTTPSNDLVNAFNAESDSVRLKSTITFLDITGQWIDKFWAANRYPFLTKYNDPANGTNDFYIIRLPDILLLKAEALTQSGDLTGALALVNQVRVRVGLPAKTAAGADAVRSLIANERRLELAFEGHRWFDLIRTGKALEVMNALKDGGGTNLNYNVQAFRLLLPIPQNQMDLNPQLTQNEGY